MFSHTIINSSYTIRYQIQRSQQEVDHRHHQQHNNTSSPSNIIYNAVTKGEGSERYQSSPVYRGLWDALIQLRRQYGWRGLYRGAMVRTLFFTPSTALTMAIYEELKVYLWVWGGSNDDDVNRLIWYIDRSIPSWWWWWRCMAMMMMHSYDDDDEGEYRSGSSLSSSTAV